MTMLSEKEIRERLNILDRGEEWPFPTDIPTLKLWMAGCIHGLKYALNELDKSKKYSYKELESGLRSIIEEGERKRKSSLIASS